MTDAAERKTFRLSRRVSVELTAGLGGLTAEWIPAMPDELTAKELRRYKQARHELLSRLAERAGGTVLVVEV